MGNDTGISAARAMFSEDVPPDLDESVPDPEPPETIPPDLDEEKPPRLPEVDRSGYNRIEKLHKLLGGLKPGWTIAIMRVRPGWCRGYLERIDILEDEPIDLDYLVSTWGGEVLRLRICDETGDYQGGVDIPLYSYPPRFRGQLMKQPEGLYQPPQTSTAIVPAAPAVDTASTVSQIMALISKARREEVETLRELFAQQRRPSVSIGSDLASFAKTYSQLRELFGGPAEAVAAVAGDDENAFMGQMSKMLEMWLSHKDKEKSAGSETWRTRGAQPPPRIGPPAPPPTNVTPVAAPQPVGDDEGDEIDPDLIASDLAELDPEVSVEAVFKALALMDPEKRQRTIELMQAKGDE